MNIDRPGPVILDRAIVQYLLSRAFLDPADIVTGGLLITRHIRRNINIAVRTSRCGVFLKQADPLQPPQTLEREAEIYSDLSNAHSAFFTSFLPKLYWYDSAKQILAIEFLEDMVSPAAEHGTVWADLFPEALGRALATLHRTAAGFDSRLIAPKQAASLFGRVSLGTFARCSQAAIDVVRIVQGVPGLKEKPDESAPAAREYTLIHGDLRWDNLLVVKDAPAGTEPRLSIVDWELAGRGDPAWDVGAVFAEYLITWIRTIPVCDGMTIGNAVGFATIQLEDCRRQVACFWHIYRSLLSARCDDDALLSRAIAACGRRLVQSAFEQAQSATKIPGSSILMLQVAENLLSDLHRSKQMLGLHQK